MSLRAFGDFVISCTAVGYATRLPDAVSDLTVLAGEHLESLARALDVMNSTRFLASGPDVPPAFNVRRAGVTRAFGSLIRLRRLLRYIPKDAHLLFHDYGWRDALIGLGHSHGGLEPAGNIYLAYERTLLSAGFQVRTAPATQAATLRSGVVRIIPSARWAHRRIPAPVISRICTEVMERGMHAEVVELEGEGSDLPGNVPVRIIKRNFASLIEVIRTSDIAVTADSLPAHLAEYLGVPVFVMSPIAKEYWLPRSCFVGDAWSLFTDNSAFSSWFVRQLDPAGLRGTIRPLRHEIDGISRR
jgi:hypothetical protein